MTATISPPVRFLAIVGVVAAIGLGAFFFLHKSSSSISSTPLPSSSSATTAGHAASTASSGTVAAKPAQRKVVLVAGLPRQVAHTLRRSRVAVVVLYSHGAVGDSALVRQARKGAKAVHAGFAAINVAGETTARAMGGFAGATTSPPEILVVKRPGKIVNRFEGFVDSQIVAQAARNAGARAR